MASHYDPAKKCRVGTMDEKQFHAESGKANGVCFAALIKAWQAAGGSLQWGAGGVGLRAEVGGKQVGICFLAPAFGGKKDRIELSLTALGKQIGADRCAALKASLQAAAGDRLTGATMVCVMEPGELPPAGQKALQKALLAVR